MRWLPICLMVLGCANDKREPKHDASLEIQDAEVDGVAVDAAPILQTCESYCAAITQACTGSNAQYDTEAHCMATCMQISVAGTAGAMSGNTRACRISHTELARIDATTHCPDAGPSGGGMCGTTCDAVCDVIVGLCSSLSGGSQWGGGNCANNCAGTGIALTGTYSTTTAMAGNTVECRLYQATKTNCSGAARPSTTPCL